MKQKKSLLISNVLDPLTRDNQDLISMYEQVSQLNYYDAIETRLIKDKTTRDKFNEISKDSKWNITYWITGEMGRKGHNLSSLDRNSRNESILEAKRLIDLANLHEGEYIGIASGEVEDYQNIEAHIRNFAESIKEIVSFLKVTESKYKLVIEPLDFKSHKKNVVGNVDTTMKLISLLFTNSFVDQEIVSFCWDSAHVALNGDDFEDSIKVLAPYISRVHFSDTINDPGSAEYGDNHRHIDGLGIMNEKVAEQIYRYVKFYSEAKNIYFAVEARTLSTEEPWEKEKEYRDFLEKTLYVE